MHTCQYFPCLVVCPTCRCPQRAAGADHHCVRRAQLAKELGMQLTPFETTVVDMAVTMLQLGLAKPVPK